MDTDSAPDKHIHSSDDEDIRNDHIPKVNLKQDWWKPLPEEDRPATPEPAWCIPSSDLPTQLNHTKPRWNATGFESKHDFTIIDSPRAVTFRDRYRVQMIMRFNKIHKFSDDTLQQIDEALDYRVKEFKVNRMNPGLNTLFWTRKDVERSKEFMFAIQKRLKTRRIFRNLESFVGRRIREGDYRLL
ncbi:hypothetical protein Tco_0318829 [Tanacetum coccineum]